MIKKLVKHGNSLALVIDKPILDLLKIDKDTPLEITTDGRGFHASPAEDTERQKQFRESLERNTKRYQNALKNLARGE